VELRELKQQAGEHWAKGHFAQAEVLYRQILLLAPLDPQLWVRHAEALKRLSRQREAMMSYQRAAMMLGELGHFQRAIAAMKLALELSPDNIDLISDLIRLEMRKNKRGTKTVEVPIADVSVSVPEAARLALPMLAQEPTRAITVEIPMPEYPLVKRVSDRELAIKPTPEGKWLIVSADTAVSLRYADEAPK
jgi:tetratricopeptide (TPR) repeat protein